MKKILNGVLLIGTAAYLSACDSSSSNNGINNIASDKIRNAQSTVSATMESVTEALRTGIANAQFTLTRPPEAGPMRTFEEEFQCNATGNTDALPDDQDFAMKSLYCMMATRTSTEVTMLGPIELAKSFVCSLGEINYDGIENTQTITVDTKCFSQDFVDAVVGTPAPPTTPSQEMPTDPENPTEPTPAPNNQFDVQVRAVDLKTLDEIGLPTDAGWTELVQIKVPDELKTAIKGNGFTVLTKSQDSEMAVAGYKDLALNPGGDMGSETFAAYTRTGADGKAFYEARTTPSQEDFSKHWRVILNGNLSSQTSRMVEVGSGSVIAANGSNAQDARMAEYISLKGDAVNGRLLLSDKQTNGQWSSDVKGICYGPTTATCEGNDGLKPANASDMAFFFQGGNYTNSYQWFVNNSYLAQASADLTFDDIQPKEQAPPEQPTPPEETPAPPTNPEEPTPPNP